MPLFTVWALLLVCAPMPAAPASPLTSAEASPAVVVKIGSASLEEYRHGDPSNRVQMLRGTQSARQF